MQDVSVPRGNDAAPRPLTTLVLTPSVGGDFFESLLTGLMREVVSADGRLIFVETRQRFSDHEAEGMPTDFASPVAWEQVDGVVTVTTAVGEDYIQRVTDAGKPVVLISSAHLDNTPAQLVRPDNHAGARMAVDHLVEHGHTRIGFVGNRAHFDIQERYEGYQQALESHGLKVDPRLVYATPNNSEAGGGMAAHALLDSDVRPTALVIATDSNAIGLVTALSERGLRVPRDLAIVAFDNAMGGTLETPMLSSIDLRFDRVGALAGQTLLQAIDGVTGPEGAIAPEAAVLIRRESCGCGTDARHGDSTRRITGEPSAQKAHFQRKLTDILEIELYTGDKAADTRAKVAIDKLVRDAGELLVLGDGVTAALIRSFILMLLQVATRPDTVRQVVTVMVEHAHRMVSQTAPGDAARVAIPSRMAAALWKAQSAALLRHTDAYNEAIAEQFAVDASMLSPGGPNPRDLEWLAGTSAKAGALALWTDETPGGTLTVVGEYHDGTAPLNLVGSELSTGEFPPEALVALAAPGHREVCVVLPVLTPEKDWGMLAVVVPIDPSVVRDTHQHWAAMLSAALEAQSREEEVRRSALIDSLTGLPNSQLFREQLEHALELHARAGTPFCVLFLDLDGFKLINDALGHQVGDRVLRKVASGLTGALRAVDTAARFGGDEFVVLLSDTGPSEAMVAAQRIQKAFESSYWTDGHEVITRASIGIASSTVEYSSADEVLRDADAAMYRAKSAAPGSIEHFDAPLHANILRRSTMVEDVVAALERDEFEVHYQPIVNLDTGRVDRFEALVRWRHPSQGLIEPGKFLDIIKETSLILQLGRKVLDEVCKQLAEWGPSVKNVSINISDKEFWSQHLRVQIFDALDKYGLSPDRLTLEITESLLMRRPEMALRLMDELHEAGLALHIDDFGTGYSSLDMLRRFPISTFKIDRLFIEGMDNGDNGSELVESLVKLGKALDMSVVAEGVETQEQRALLQQMGCASGQGFLFMPAVTGERAGELLGQTFDND